jgi:hypothetical protein
MRELLPHQAEALQYARMEEHPAFLLEMRLGKTLVAIRTAQERGLKRCLVLAPKTVLGAWANELTLEEERYIIGTGDVRNRAVDADFLFSTNRKERLWYLTNYEGLSYSQEHRSGSWKMRPSPLVFHRWDAVFADESVILKNPRAQVTKSCLEGFRGAEMRSIMTGLIAPESELDLFCQFAFLDGHFDGWRNFYSWRTHNFVKNERAQYIPLRGVAKEIKDYVHRRGFIRTRSQVRIGPRKMYETRYIDPPAALTKAYTACKKDFAYQFANGDLKETNWQVVLEMWLSRLAGGFDPHGNLVSDHKLKELYYLLSGDLAKEPVVVWFRFNAEIDAAVNFLRAKGITCRPITGEDSQDARREILADFGRKFRVLLAQIKCARYGVDCRPADAEIYYSCTWSCNDHNQSEDRIVHPDKTAPVLVLFLATAGTSDVDVVEGLKMKTLDAKMLLRNVWKDWGP